MIIFYYIMVNGSYLKDKTAKYVRRYKNKIIQHFKKGRIC